MQLPCDAMALFLPQRQNAVRQVLQFFPRATQRRFCPHALCGVAQHHGKELAAIHLDLRNRRLDREFTAVGMQREQRALLAHLAKTPHVRLVCTAKTFRHEIGQRTADGMLGRASEQGVRHGIEQNDALGIIHGNDGLHGGADDARQPGLALLQVGQILGHRCTQHAKPQPIEDERQNSRNTCQGQQCKRCIPRLKRHGEPGD